LLLATHGFSLIKKYVYILIGYGPIRGTLSLRGLKDDGVCPVCRNEQETVEYMILKWISAPSFPEFRKIHAFTGETYRH